ncbi:hypothetical protein HAZT_HAZT007377 [Hyalella azteca]|uniref:Peptidase S1 domain-containing protein n=1 Tax=Hyalella azteca TaxID=294128 RepID=A0A6A0GWS5_HYAAZ|nr:hypothetical protein HAZT_HAZT007377 [Hyalella azteca]
MYSKGSRGWSSRGFLQSRDDGGSWSPVCPTDARIPNLVKNLCDELVGDSSDDFKNVPNADISRGKCPSGSLVHVTCAAASCQGAIDIQASTRTKSPSVAPRGDKPNKEDFIDPKKRLIGGEDAPEGSWPSIVSLRKDGVHDCGGTVLSASYVMVAAHCMRRPRSHLFEVHAGLYKRSTFAPTAQLVPVDKVYVHVNISSNSLVNDIAILHLKEPLHLNK